MEAKLISALQLSLGQFKKGNLVGTNVSARITAASIGQREVNNLGAIGKQYSVDLKIIQTTVDVLDKNIKERNI
jgi:hypothetical protein